MTKFRNGMSPEEQKDFLTHTRLFLSKDIKRTLWTKDVYVLKHTPTAKYLFVSSDELFVLGCFGRGSTVAELVPHLIMNRRCPPLKELYELILQASETNMLNEHREEEFPSSFAPRWWPSIDRDAVQAVWWLSFFAGLVAFFSWNRNGVFEAGAVRLPLWGYPVAWLTLAACASFGSLLASAYVHRVGGEVHRPGLHWKTLLPRIGFDWSDCVMGGPDAAALVAKLRIVPFLLLAFLCATLSFFTEFSALAPFTAAAIGGLLWRVAPFPGGPASQWLEARKREPLHSVQRGKHFYRTPKTFSARLFAEFKATEWSYALWLGGYSAIWSLMVIWFVGAAVTGDPVDTFPAMFSRHSVGVLQLFGIATGLLAAGLLFTLVYGWYKGRQDDASSGEDAQFAPEAGSGDVLRTFDDSLLFRELPVEVRTELSKLARSVSVSSGKHVVGPGERGEDLYIVDSGEFDIVVQDAKSSGTVVARLRRGDVFGELSFFGGLFRSQNLRAHGAGTLMAMSSPELEQTLKRFLSIPAIEEIVQKRTFLRRIPLSAGWQAHSIARFAKCARFEDMKEGQVIIGTGRENRFFYLVHEGLIEVRHRGRRKGRIRGGDFFGEISLMLNNPATSDIVAVESTRCLVLQKSDFLALMGQDIELALQMEHIASRRLGRPIFPFLGSSIEAIAN